jgi:hypothetical protein
VGLELRQQERDQKRARRKRGKARQNVAAQTEMF